MEDYFVLQTARLAVGFFVLRRVDGIVAAEGVETTCFAALSRCRGTRSRMEKWPFCLKVVRS
jgi:hypothetical protein